MNRWSVFYLLAILVWSSCDDIHPPAVPSLTTEEAQNVGRHTAVLTGTVACSDIYQLDDVCFRYGPSAEMSSSAPVEQTDGQCFTLSLENLAAGSVYHFCLEVKNGNSLLRSAVRTFQTLESARPTLGEISVLSKGPFGATLSCRVTDDGGEPLQEVGFLYRKTGSTQEEKFHNADTAPDGTFSCRIDDLEQGASFDIRAIVENSLGCTYSEPVTVKTDNAIIVDEPGQLADIIGESLKYRLTQLTVSGRLNGTDFRFLREMAGSDVNGNATQGKLSILNLENCTIAKGGEAYYLSQYTCENVFTQDIFCHCNSLQQIILPQTLTTVENNAFRGCTGLTKIYIPDAVCSFGFSSGCSRLSEYEVTASHPVYASVDGILYSKDRSALVLYPSGKWMDTFVVPEEVIALKESAFREAGLKTITLPEQLKTLEDNVFAGSSLTEIRLPDTVERLPKNAFQNCTSLTAVTLGTEMNYLSEYCFAGCTALREMHLRPDYPPFCVKEAFTDDIVLKECKVYVPTGSKTLYRSTSTWESFAYVLGEPGN